MIRKILMGLAAVVGFTTVATAATPVAVWDGDFTSLTRGDYTWTASAGTTVASDMVTIGSDGGLEMTVPTTSAIYNRQVTVILDAEVPSTITAESPLIDIYANGSYVTLTTDATTLRQRWDFGGSYGSYAWTPGRQKIAVTYKASNPPGTRSFVNGVNVMAAANLMSGKNNLNTLKLGCYAKGGTTKVAEGLKIYRVALFDTNISDADVAAYQFPSEIKEYYATLDGHVYEWTDLDGKWNPKMPPEGFSATDTLVITNEANQSFFMDKDVTALKLKIVSSPDAPALALTADEEEVSLAIGTYDFSEAESKATIKYGMTASVVAGKDTVLEKANDPSLTIAEGKKLTVSYGGDTAPTLTASKVSNAGTLNFEGGTAESPIYIDGGVAAGLGTITLDENTCVKQDDKGTSTKYTITGSGKSSFFTVARNGTGAPGMIAGSSFADVIVGSAATASGKEYWLEHATIADTVGLNLTGNLKLSDLTPNPVVIRSLTGTYNLSNNNGSPALTICCKEDANFAGTSGIPITIGEGAGTQTFSGAYTGALTVEEDGQVKLTGAANPSSISGLGSVTLANGTGTVTNTSDTANFTGTITVDASVTTLFLGTSRPECDFIFAGTTEVVYTENVSDDGVVQQLNVTSGAEPTYKVMGVDGEEKEIKEGTYTPTVTGKAALYAWEFNGTLASVGQDTATMGQDHGPFYTDDNEAAYAYSMTYKGFTWPTEFTTSIACTLPTNETASIVGFGQKSGGFALIAGDVSKNEVKLVYWPSDTHYTVLTTMTVPNASTCEHLYLVTKTADSLKVYLDGTLAAEYNGALTLGLGVQIGTVFQGVGNTGLVRLDKIYSGTNDCKAVVNSLRIYKTVLGPNAIAQLVTEFPYVSPNGTFTRALTGAENQWVADGAWTKKGEANPYAKPDAESTVELSAAEEATITLNLDEPTDYEALNLSGDGAITIAAPAANENKISSSGLVKIGSDATIEYSAMDLAGTTIEIAKDKTLTIDASMIDLSQYYASTTVPLTGLVTGEGEIAFEVPEAITGRSAEAQFNESNNTWELKIEVISAPFIYDGGEWTWSGEGVSTETVSNNTDVAVLVRSGTLEWPMDRASFEVQGGTLKAATAPTVPCTVEVTQKAGTFDLNGIAPTSEANNFTVTMAGGKLTNSSEAQGLIKSLTLTGGATVDTSVGVIAIQSQKGGWGATTLTLDAHSLTKTGTNRLEFVATTVVSDGGSIEVDEGTIWTQESSNFGDATIHISTSGAFEVRSGVTATVQTINGDGKGAKIIVHGTISAFTLKDTATIEGEGTFGTITLEDDGTLYIGEKRGLTLEGEGTVDAQLTLVEMAAAEPITLFTTTEGEFDVELTDYNGNELVEGEGYNIEGGVVTPTAIPFIYDDGWSWNGDEVTPEIVAAATAGAIIVEGGTCEWNIDRDITVDGGTLKATGAKKATAAITVNEEGTFDVNGKENTTWTVLLKGGSLVNNGTAIGNTKKQINLLTVEEYDSTVDAAANFGLIADGYKATTLDLGGKKLTKTGAATFWLASTTVTNGTFEVSEGTLQTVGDNDTRVVVFADDASLVLDEGTTLAVTRPLTIGTIEVKGATIDNTKSISAFTLKYGEATLSGNGTWGKITLESKWTTPAVLNVGTIRGLTLDGNGTVNVVLTAAEIAQQGPIEIFTNESTDVEGDTVLDEAGNEVPGQWLGGTYQVTHEAKIGTTYYLSFKTAIGALQDGDTLTLLKSIETDEKAAFVIDNDITLDFGDYTVEKTVANDYTFDITTNATVTFTGKTGGVKQTASELNPKTPAAAIRNKGNLTITGGVYTSDVCVIKNDEDPGAGELTVEGGTFEIVEAAEGMAQIPMALMNWATATISGGTWNGTIGTRSCDGNKVSKAGATEITSSLKGTVDYLLYVGYPGDTTYANVPAIKGVAKSNVTLGKVSSITDKLELVEEGDWVTVQKASPIQPVDPSAGGVIECEDEATATALAAAITDNPSQYVKAPEGLDETAAAIYKGMFCATASGTTVTLKLTEEGEAYLQGIVDEATDDPDIAAALCDPTATSITYADGTFMLGFYYWVAGGTDVKALTTAGAAKQPTAYGDMTLDKPALGETTQGFYVIRADFKKPQPQPVK